MQYLHSHATRSAGEEPGTARLRIVWRDGPGRELGAVEDGVPASPRGYHTFSLLATAPAAAATATVHLEAEAGEVWFDDVSLRAVAPE